MARMTCWADRHYYSMDLDADVARVSGWDDHSQEHWMIVPTGRGYAERRRAAVEIIMQAVEDGHEPGEVESDE